MRHRFSTMLCLVSVCCAAPYAAIFQEGKVVASSGSAYPQVPGTSGFREKVFTNNYFRSWGASGTILHNVNTLTGQPVYSVPLTTIGAGAISFPVTLTYSGPVRGAYEADNQAGATSWVGYGWNLSTPFVAANHMGTTADLDDLYFCNLGQYGGGQLLQKATDLYFVSSNPSITVSLQRDIYGHIIKWFFLTPDGVRLTFGSNVAGDGAGRGVNHYLSFISGNPGSTALSPDLPYVYRWDISRIEEYGTSVVPSFPSLEFRYNRIEVPIGYGLTVTKTYTRESYLSEIIRKDSKGNKVESIAFETSPKTASEYAAKSFTPSLVQEVYETRYLTRVHRFSEDRTTPDVSYVLESHVQAADSYLMYPKRVLDSVRFEYPNPRGGVLAENRMRWKFTYESDPAKHLALKTIEKPFFGKDEFEYGQPSYQYSVWNQATKQDGAIRKLTTKQGVEIALPTSNSDVLANWENQSYCTEKFCYMAVVKKGLPETMHLEVWKNNGNFFELAKRDNGDVFRETFTSDNTTDASARRLKILPWGDNFIVVDAKDSDFWMFEWNGESFSTVTKSVLVNRSLNTGTGEFIDIHLGNDFFLVEDKGTFKDCASSSAVTGTKFYVVKKVNGVWKDLNEGATCGLPVDRTSCTVDFPGNYGESNYLASGCLAMNTSNLMTSAGKGQFHVVHASSGMIFPFYQNLNGIGFTPKGNTIQPFNSTVQKASYPMNWEATILGPIQIGKDYFLVKSTVGSTVRIDVMNFDGWAIGRVGGPVYTISGLNAGYLPDVISNLNAWVSDDYFITTAANIGRDAEIWIKRIQKDANGVPTGIVFNGSNVRTDLPRGGEADIKVATHPYAFSIEAYPDGKAPGGQPKAAPLLETDGSGDYKSYLYQVNPQETGSTGLFASISPAIYRDANGRKLFDYSFSSFDNLLIARSCVSSTNGSCTGLESDRAGFYTAMMHPWRTPYGLNFVRNLFPVHNPWSGQSYDFHYSQYTIGNSGRLGSVCLFNLLTRRVEFGLLQYMGTGLTQYPYQITINSQPWADLNFVSKFKTYGDISGQGGGRWTEHVFKYTTAGSSFLTKDPEYNSHLRSFIFPNVSVYTYRGSESETTPLPVGAETVKHITDEVGAPLPETHFVKLGLRTERRLDDLKMVQGETLLERNMSKTVFEYYAPQRETSWPEKLYMARLKKTTATTYDRNGSSQTRTTSFHKYNPNSNSPLFAKTYSADKWNLKQTMFYSSGINQGLSAGHNHFVFTAEPSDAALDGWSNHGSSFNLDNAFEKVINASRVEFDPTFPFLAKKSMIWKDDDPTLTDDELKKGEDPIFSLSEGWQDREIIEKRNDLGQALESRILLNNSGNDMRSVNIFEGRASLPVARFENAYYEDVAYLSGENFNVAGLTTHDWQGRWIKADAGATELISHSGRASIKVVNNTGPRADLVLKGAQGQGYDYIVSAWIYCTSGTIPALKVERFRSDGASFGSVTVNSPSGTNFISNRWQRYEVRITNSNLRANNLFSGTGSGDYLRINVGTSGPGTLYVDDIVCRPSTSTFSLQAYDGRQRIIHSQDMNHNMATHEYDLFDNATAVRDDKHRIFTSSAGHQPGEND